MSTMEEKIEWQMWHEEGVFPCPHCGKPIVPEGEK